MDPSVPVRGRTDMAPVSVRPARPEDATEIARVQAVTWRTAYRSVLPAEVLDRWDEAAAAETWRASIASPPTPGHAVLVAIERDQVVGFAAFGPAELTAGELPDPVGPTTEIATLLVEPRWGRRGHGSRLMAAATDLARADGMTRAVSWVPEADTVSREFMIGAGWATDGLVRALDTGAGELRELRLHVSL
jgi:GNAT superfamily N-acetyltransferase